MITDSDHSVSGEIQQQDAARRLVARTKTQTSRSAPASCGCCSRYGSVTVQLPGGEQQWQFVRLEN